MTRERRPPGGERTINVVIGAFAALTLAALLLLVAERIAVGGELTTDPIIFLALRVATDRPGAVWIGLQELMLSATAFGSFPTLVIVTCGVAALLASFRRGAVAGRYAAATLSGIARANLLKHVVGRPRPEG